MFTIPQAVKNKIFELRTPDRPYSLPSGSNKWVHQDIAVKTFLEKEHGILAMATGTGKTITAMKIINKLFDGGDIRRVVITMYGNYLLDQWAIQIRENYKNKQNINAFEIGGYDISEFSIVKVIFIIKCIFLFQNTGKFRVHQFINADTSS